MNPNTREYWNTRFQSGDWEDNAGRQQTSRFAEEIVERLGLGIGFSGTLLDFGCGLGDAIPVYRKAFPKAKLIGVDHSSKAVELCASKYGSEAQFVQSDHMNLPCADIIVASNVLEHMDGDLNVAASLLRRCSVLFVAVPYCEEVVEGGEHVRSYDSSHFDTLGVVNFWVYRSKGWGHGLFGELYHVHMKNVLRRLLDRKPLKKSRQILFRICSNEVKSEC